jgi:hypothetical protein
MTALPGPRRHGTGDIGKNESDPDILGSPRGP